MQDLPAVRSKKSRQANGIAYEDPGASYDEEHDRDRILKGLFRRAKEFGYELSELTVSEGIS